MSKKRSFSGNLTPQETAGGFGYLAFQLLFLPGVLSWANGHLEQPLSASELNFVFFLTNFIAVLLIFHGFLGNSLRQVLQHPAYFCQAVVLGLAAYYACTWVTTWAVGLLVPGFSNYNDQSIAQMLRSDPFLILVGTVVLVPTAEECLYRGLIFRNLYSRSPWAAYVISILAFAVIHILGYIGQYSPLELTMAFLQYLPAGLCLAWAYTKAGTIFAPILIHAVINFISINGLR